MMHKLFNFASLASLAMFCVMTALIGGVGIWGNYSHRFLHLLGPWECSAAFTRMGVQIVVLHEWPSPVAGPTVPKMEPARSQQYAAFQAQFPHRFAWKGPFGFEYGPIVSLRGNRMRAVGSRTWLMFPFRVYLGALLLLPAIRFVVLPLGKRIRRARRPGGCRSCGYDLTGNASGVCPECGTPLEKVAGVGSGAR